MGEGDSRHPSGQCHKASGASVSWTVHSGSGQPGGQVGEHLRSPSSPGARTLSTGQTSTSQLANTFHPPGSEKAGLLGIDFTHQFSEA